MKISLHHVGLLGLSGLHLVTGHYGYPYAAVDDGEVSKRWEYIRPTTDFTPNHDYDGPDGMCGRNATLPMFPVKTLKVAPGSTIHFVNSYMTEGYSQAEQTNFDDYVPGFKFYHTGPATAYLSKAPGDDLNTYSGDGDWFKIAAVGASNGMRWDYSVESGKDRISFKIPESTPPGKYLMRGEHLNMENGGFYKTTEMYINCMHLEITGNGQGKPGPVTHFPGAFDALDPGIWLPAALFRPYRPMEELKNWQGAGPAVWKG